MPTRVLYGPAYTDLRDTAIDRADEIASDDPLSILWLEQNDHVSDGVADAWAEFHDPLRLTVSSLDETVRNCYDAATGPRSFLDALTRRRLIDRALRELDTDILQDGHRYRGDVLEVVAELEAEGYASTALIRGLTEQSPINDELANFITETYERFENNQAEVLTDEEFTGSDAYGMFTETDWSPRECLPMVDVVVLSGYYELSTSQQAVVRTLNDAFPLVVTLPVLDVPDSHEGSNELAVETFDFYRSLPDVTEIRRVTSSASSELGSIAGQLYTPTEESEHEPSPERLQWIEAPTPEREVRTIARSIRHRIATDPDVTQGNVIVVIPGLISYREEIEDAFTSVGLTPVTVVNKLLYQTYTGRAMIDLVALCRDDDVTPATLASLATNPVVGLDVDGPALSRIARALPTTEIDSLLEEADSGDEAELTVLLGTATSVSDQEGAAVVQAVREMFAAVDLEDRVETLSEADGVDFDAAMEARAFNRVDRALTSIERVARQTQRAEPVSVLEVIADELDQIRVPPPTQSANGVIEVAGPREAFNRDYDHLYLAGMTDQDFPPNPDRPRFFEALFEGLPGIEPTDERALARYQFGTMLASADTVHITTPETTSDDEPLLESPIVDELRRVTGITSESNDLGNAYREDVQRAIGQTVEVDAHEGIERAISAGSFDGPVVERVRRGVSCASQRASPRRTEHDGQVDHATVEALYPNSVREPYSPTRLNSYAKCGFRFAMDRILDLEEPLDYNIEPDPLDYGSLVHDVLEYFYRGLQDGPSDPVDLTAWQRDELEYRMLAAGEQALEEAGLPYEGSFFDRWLEMLFAGLGSPDENPYYGAGGDDTDGVHTDADGLFAKFITEERERDEFETPGWFEVGMDLSEDDGAPLVVETPNGPVPVGGRIDRITVDWSRDPPEGLVHDYKSSSRSAGRAVDGISFQLPLYAIAAGNVLGEEGVATPFDGAFYIMDHGDLGDGWSLTDYLSYEGDGTAEDYRRLIEEATPRRVGDLVAGIEDGAFHPTVLDEDTAGCRHCDFSDVCDVRYHARRDVIAQMDADSLSGYVPQEARPDSFLDTCGGDDE